MKGRKVLDSGLPDEVDDEEPIARFLWQKNLFSSNGVKAAAFMPHPRKDDNNVLEVSVSRHGKSPIDDLWDLGRKALGDRTLYGAAILEAKKIRAEKLSVTADEPPARHAVIRGWEGVGKEKALLKNTANRLASAAGFAILLENS